MSDPATVTPFPQSTPEPVKLGEGSSNVIVRIIHFFAHVVVLLVWTIVGFLLWVPFLTRMIMVFMGAIITTIYKNSDPTKAQKGLEAAIHFYVYGYQLILASMRRELQGRPFHDVEDIAWYRVVAEVAFAIIFWVGITTTWYVLVQSGWTKVASYVEQPKIDVPLPPARPMQEAKIAPLPIAPLPEPKVEAKAVGPVPDDPRLGRPLVTGMRKSAPKVEAPMPPKLNVDVSTLLEKELGIVLGSGMNGVGNLRSGGIYVQSVNTEELGYKKGIRIGDRLVSVARITTQDWSDVDRIILAEVTGRNNNRDIPFLISSSQNAAAVVEIWLPQWKFR